MRSPQFQWQLDPNRFGGLLVVLGLAAIYAAILFPADFIYGTSSYWLAQNEDVTQYVAGFNAFFREPWHWPLWKITSINWPDGTLSTFVDIIPLYAAFLKLLAPQDWFVFNPFGWWILLGILLQAIICWWLMREAQIKNWAPLITLTLITLTLPTWINRLGQHISLNSHWLILIAFALVMRQERTNRPTYLAWFFLLTGTFFINIYLFVMIVSISLFASAGIFLRKENRTPSLKNLALFSAIFVLLLWITMWPLPSANGGQEYGFGVYSLNLIAPIAGGRYWHFNPDAISGEQHFEGFNYLGLGVLALILISISKTLWQRWLKKTNSATKIWPLPLWLLFAVFTLYALSNKIYLGEQLIYQWQVPHWAQSVTGQFRASGRFFWPAAYGLCIYTVISIDRLFTTRLSALILFAACSIQLIDIEPQLSQTSQSFRRSTNAVISYDALKNALPPDIQTLYVFPKFKCGNHVHFTNTLLPFMRFAAENQININGGYIARYNPSCQKEVQEIQSSIPQTSAYIFAKDYYTDSTINSFFSDHKRSHCQSLDQIILCTINQKSPPN